MNPLLHSRLVRVHAGLAARPVRRAAVRALGAAVVAVGVLAAVLVGVDVATLGDHAHRVVVALSHALMTPAFGG